MKKSFIDDRTKLHEWQSSACMIPVLLELVKEKFSYIDEKGHDFSARSEIEAYHTIYQSWQKSHELNSKQLEWVEQIGDYLMAIQQILFRPPTKKEFPEISKPSQLSCLKF